MQKENWFRHFIKPLPGEKRKEVSEEMSRSISPGSDFFLMVVLSCSIATLGLITDSPAVIIGAMLIAPLMSPIIGLGMATITGNPRLLKNSLSSLLRGAFLAVALAVAITFVNNNLPFFNIQELPKEIVARTRPSPIDLTIALAGGIAAAYAITQPNISAALPGVAIATALMPPLCTIGIGIALNRADVAGGAALLFITNTITIAFASALVFFLRGFSSNLGIKDHIVPRSLVYAALLTLALLIPLSYFSIKFFVEASENRLINSVVEKEVSKIAGSELVNMQVVHNQDELEMFITIRSSTSLDYYQVVNLQKSIVDGIHRPVTLKVSQVLAKYLDPMVPPTYTPTQTLVFTASPGPSQTPQPATPTNTPTNTPTSTNTATATPTETNTPTMTSTPTATQTLSSGRIGKTVFPEMKIYQVPNGPVIGTLRSKDVVTLMDRKTIDKGLVWVEIQDSEGRIGWIPELYITIIESTPTRMISPSQTQIHN